MSDQHSPSSGELARVQPGLALGLLRSLRPWEWIKNTLVFAAAVFSGQFFVRQSFLLALATFAAMCLAASGTYLLNDVRDRESDRRHPEKRNRPVASGAVPVGAALIAALLLDAGSVGLAFWVNVETGFTVSAYLLLTTLYSLTLKHVVILDAIVLAMGFVLRVIAGAEAIRVEFSSWLVLCTFLLALFLGFAKRRHEITLLEEDAKHHRPILGEYSTHFLDMMMAVVTSATVMSYVLYTMDPETVKRFHSRNVIYTTVFVVYGVFRYLYLIYLKSAGGSPVRTVLEDRSLQVTVVLWITAILLLRYFS